ncbi:MAG: hypothetical protein D6698_08550 [Gammaproteobacteria bacterium]|nr:MAG: hypothetical protein D6698_08550 [Gammaproteobacteria bacterium]
MTTKLSTEAVDDYGNTQGIGIQIQVPTATTYTIVKVPFKCRIETASYVTSQGTATLDVKIDSGTPVTVGGLGSLSCSTTQVTSTATNNNTVNVGDNILFTISSPSASPQCENLSVMLKVVKLRD